MRRRENLWPLTAMSTRCKYSGLIFAGAATADAQSQPEERIFHFPLWGGGSDYSGDETVSFLREAATKQTPGTPQVDWRFFFGQSQETGAGTLSNDHTRVFSLLFLCDRHSVQHPLTGWANIIESCFFFLLQGNKVRSCPYLVGKLIIKPKLSGSTLSWRPFSTSYQVSSLLGLAKNFKILPPNYLSSVQAF